MLFQATILTILLFIASTIQSPTSTLTVASCPQGWTNINNNCYIYNSKSLANSQAAYWCERHGATLINIHTQNDLNIALSLNQNEGSFWVSKGMKIKKNFSL